MHSPLKGFLLIVPLKATRNHRNVDGLEIFSNFVIEYFGEIEKEFENTLACLSGAQIGSKHEKKR